MAHKRNKIPTSFTLSDTAKDLLEQLAERQGLSKTGLLEVIIREKARDLGLTETG